MAGKQKNKESPEEKKQEKKTEEVPKEKPKEDNVIYVGKKPTMSYVMAVITQFTDGQKEVHVKSRGKSISRAVDVVEAVRNKFMKDIKYEIEISTEEIKDREGKNLNVSVIDIKLSK